jgi:5,10-methenyltetrahydrofolate synthetase
MTQDDWKNVSGPASPPCFATDLVAGQPCDPETRRDVARFRRAERDRLIAERLAVPAATRATLAAEIGTELDRLVDPRPGIVISLYWPFRGELDMRGWMASAHGRGAGILLPVVVAKAEPLVFRAWSPGCAMTRGVWNIPVPRDGPDLVPDVVIAPLVGVDRACFRLGYGGGFYDRTLASLPRKALVVGIGPSEASIPTIFPQPWDVPMDIVVTGSGQVRERQTV